MAASPRRSVLLRHHLPDGTSHIDWFLAPDADDTSPLTTFRVARRVDELETGDRLPARRLPDHRPKYLDYEGPISGDRGAVARIVRGRVITWHIATDGTWTIELAWERRHGPARYQRLRIVKPDDRHALITAIPGTDDPDDG